LLLLSLLLQVLPRLVMTRLPMLVVEKKHLLLPLNHLLRRKPLRMPSPRGTMPRHPALQPLLTRTEAPARLPLSQTRQQQMQSQRTTQRRAVLLVVEAVVVVVVVVVVERRRGRRDASETATQVRSEDANLILVIDMPPKKKSTRAAPTASAVGDQLPKGRGC
jgi:hypothetical protein